MYKVIIVDDEPLILEGLRHIITYQEFGMEIIGEAAYGDEALTLIGEKKPDILITDIKMPFMDGIELIKTIREKGLNIKCIVLSGYDDFQYVKEAIKLGIENYLLKPISRDELISTLKNAICKIESDLDRNIEFREVAGIIKNNILYRWVTNDIKGSELITRSALLDISLECKKFVVICFRIVINANGPKNHFIDNITLLRYAAQNIIDETVDKSVRIVTFPDMEGDIVGILTDTTMVQEKFFRNEILPKCISNLKSYLNIDTFISVGGDENEYVNVYRSYYQAKDLQNYRLIKPNDKIVLYNEVSKAEIDKLFEVQIDYSLFSNYIISNNKDAALSIIDDFKHFLENANGITPVNVQNIVIEILFNTINIIKSIKGDTIVLKVFNDLYVKVLQIKTIDELIELLYFVVNYSVDCLQLEDDKNDTLIKKMLAYIQSNYSKDLNLKTIASELSNNPAYLGQVFKQKTGESFTNYLNKVRVEKAKELLSKTNLKINEISEKIGYYNITYFCTIFKKITGSSPSTFKEEKN